jgi:hypothetical protein
MSSLGVMIDLLEKNELITNLNSNVFHTVVSNTFQNLKVAVFAVPTNLRYGTDETMDEVRIYRMHRCTH